MNMLQGQLLLYFVMKSDGWILGARVFDFQQCLLHLVQWDTQPESPTSYSEKTQFSLLHWQSFTWNGRVPGSGTFWGDAGIWNHFLFLLHDNVNKELFNWEVICCHRYISIYWPMIRNNKCIYHLYTDHCVCVTIRYIAISIAFTVNDIYNLYQFT